MSGAAAVVIVALLVWSPWWQLQVLLGAGVVTFIIMLRLNPLRWYRRMASGAVGAALAVGGVPAIEAAYVSQTVFAQFTTTHSTALVIALVLFASVCAVLDHLTNRVAAVDKDQCNAAPTVSSLGDITQSQQSGVSVVGNVGTINHYAHPSNPRASTEPVSAAHRNRVSPSNLPALSPNVVSRTPLMHAIHAAMSTERSRGSVHLVVVRAHGGYGKSVAALQYGHQHGESYPGGQFFLTLENSDFTSQLASLAKLLKITASAEIEETAEAVRLQLQAAEPSLLILDNVRGSDHWNEIVETGLLPSSPCHILITTRAESIPKATIVKVGRLTHEESIAIFDRFCHGTRPNPDTATAIAITEWLEGLAVAIAAVGARMRLRPNVKWGEYWTHLQNLTLHDLPDADPRVRAELGGDARGLEEHRRTLRVIDDAIKALDPLQRRIVDYSAMLPANAVPAPWLTTMVDYDAKGGDGRLAIRDNSLAPDEPARTASELVHSLCELDVLRSTDSANLILSLHRLWRERVLEAVIGDTNLFNAMWERLGELFAVRLGAVVGFKPHDVRISAKIEVSSMLQWELSPLARLCNHMWQRRETDYHIAMASTLASILQKLGRHHEARDCVSPIEQCFDQLKQSEIKLDATHLMAQLASIEYSLHHYQQALSHLQQAMAIERECSSPQDPMWIGRLELLAGIQESLGNLEAAEQSAEAAVSMLGKSDAAESSGLAQLYIVLSRVQLKRGRIAAAEQSTKSAMDASVKAGGLMRPEALPAFSNLAMLMWSRGDYVGAESLLVQVIERYSLAYGNKSRALAALFSQLSMVQKARNRLEQAMKSVNRAIELYSELDPNDYMSLAAMYSNRALVLRRMHRIDDARRDCIGALDLLMGRIPDCHPSVGAAFANLGHVEASAGNAELAKKHWRHALQVLRHQFADDHPQIQDLLYSIEAVEKLGPMCDEERSSSG